MSEHTTTAHPPPDPEIGRFRHGITDIQIRNEVRAARDTVIEPILRGHASRFADNVESVVMEQVWRHVTNGTYDPEKSSLRFWVRRIAKNRARDELKRITRSRSWQSEQLIAEHPEKTVEQQMEENIYHQHAARGSSEDHAGYYAEIEADKIQVESVLVIVKEVMDTLTYDRAYYCIYNDSGHSFQEAAERFGHDPAYLRYCVRSLQSYAIVVSRAQEAVRKAHSEVYAAAAEEGRQPSDEELAAATAKVDSITGWVACLPTEGEAGGFRERIGTAIIDWVRHGGTARNVPAEFVADFTGDAFHTVRQRLGEVKSLLYAAHRAIRAGTLDDYDRAVSR